MPDSQPASRRAGVDDVKVLPRSSGWGGLQHNGVHAYVSDAELLETIVNAVPQARSAVVDLIHRRGDRV